jgi:hypothetical protein
METSNIWVKHPVYNLWVHTAYGFVVNAEGQAAKTFRNKQKGHILVVISDKTVKNAVAILARVIVEAITGQIIPRNIWVQHKDRFKWNFNPNNLFLTNRKLFTQRFFVDNQWVRLSNTLSQTAKLILEETGTKDYDAVGHMFRVSGQEIEKLNKGMVWEYIPKFLGVTPEILVNKIEEFRTIESLFNSRDENLRKEMIKGAQEYRQ